MNRKKIIGVGSLLLSFTAIAGVVSSSSIVSNMHDNSNFASISKRSLLPLSNTSVINENSSITLPESLSVNFQSVNSFCTLPNGVFIPASPVASLINPTTNEVVWQLKNQDGSNSNIGTIDSTRILCSQYNANVSALGSNGGTLVIAAMDGDGIRITLVNADTGVIFEQGSVINFTRQDSSDFSTYLYPVQGTNDSYIMISRGTQLITEDNNCIFEFSLSNLNDVKSHIGFKYGFNNYFSDRNLTILAAAAYVFGDDTYLITVENYAWDNNSNYLKLYRNFEHVSRLKINECAPTFMTSIPNLKLVTNGNEFTVYGVINPDQADNSTAFCAIWTGSVWAFRYNVTLQGSNYDYNISTGYYDSNVDKFITYASIANKSETGGIVVFDLNDPYNKDMTPTGGQVQIFRYRDDDMLGANRMNNWIPILTSYNNFNNGNFLVTASGNNDYVLYDISAYDVNDTDSCHYAYNTSLINNQLVLTGASEFDLLNKSSSDISSQFDEQYSALFSQNSTTTQWLIHSNYDDSINYNNIYAGKIVVTLYATGAVYDKGNYLNISASDEDFENIFKFDNVLLSGFKVWNTNIDAPVDFTYDGGINQDNIWDLSSNDVKSWINKNFSFTDTPVNFDFNRDVNVSISKNLFNKNVDVKIKLNNVINDGVVGSREMHYSFKSTDTASYSWIIYVPIIAFIILIIIAIFIVVAIIRRKRRIKFQREISFIDSMLY